MAAWMNRLRMMFIVVLGVIQMATFPVSLEEEVFTSPASSTETETVYSRIDPPSKPMVRKTPTLMQRLIMLASALPLCFVLPLLLVLRIPKPRLPFVPCVFLRKKYLLLLPIKFTSSYVA